MKIEKVEKCRVAYMRRVGVYGAENFKLMEEFKKWALDNNLLNKGTIYAIAQDNPEITPPQNCRYDICITISNDYKIDNLVDETRLDGGNYAIYKIKHTTEDIQKAWGKIFIDLKQKGYIIDNKSIMERYSKDMIDNGYCEICVPVKIK